MRTDGGVTAADETTEENPTDTYVRKMRERPYRERLAIRTGFREPDDIETTELGVPIRVGLFALGVVSLWLGWNPSTLVGSGVNRGGGLAAIVQSGTIGQLAVGVFMFAFGLLFVAISYTGRVPAEGKNTNRDLLP
ncbi:hypothetical protein [Halorussus salinus]|uniref:hypothetical protein n=1 Tax=Halorussus salinus TaxID=1364935 RepID=UPI001092B4FB|nr:hypothetical protein [Halorussus salinus]